MSELKRLLRERIVILDGAMGTQLQALDLSAADFGGPALEGCNENLVLTRPDAIARIHDAYFEAGADIVESNSFGAVRHVLAEYGLEDKTLEIAQASGRLAAESARRHSTPERPRFAAGALGPGTKTISVTGGITFDEVRRHYAEAARGLMEGGVDLLLLETQQDTLNIKASMLGFADAFVTHLAKGRAMYGCQFTGTRYDCGNKLGFLKAQVELGLKHPETGADFKRYLKQTCKGL